jgi:putative transposase
MKPTPESSTQEVLAGLVERVTFHNAENGFCVLRAKALGHRDLVTVVGHTPRRHRHAATDLRSFWSPSSQRDGEDQLRWIRFPPEIIDQAIWLYLRFTLSLRDVEDLLAERGVALSYETVRRWVNHFGPMIAADLRKRRQKPHTTWHLDEVYLKIDGRMVYLWRAVDAEGEVLDVLVQSKRNKHAALKLMRKLLRKYAFVPERLITDDLRSYSAAVRDLGIERRHERGRWQNIERRIRISRRGGGSARCSGSRARVQPRNSCQRMPPSTISSTSNVISLQPERTARFALWRWTHGGPPSQQPDNS